MNCPLCFQPENILLKSKDEDIIKLSDFGLSRVLGDGTMMQTMCGTPQYVGEFWTLTLFCVITR